MKLIGAKVNWQEDVGRHYEHVDIALSEREGTILAVSRSFWGTWKALIELNTPTKDLVEVNLKDLRHDG